MDETRYGLRVDVPLDYEQAVERTTTALKEEGFGVLTTIDVKQTLKQKLDADFRRYVILGACNPPLAYAALSADPSVGLLLPCNVAVEATDDGTSIVRLTDPSVLLTSRALAENSTLRRVADDARQRLVRVAAALSTDATG